MQAVWYAAEAFGDVVGLTKGGKKQGGAAVEVSPISRDDAMTALKEARSRPNVSSSVMQWDRWRRRGTHRNGPGEIPHSPLYQDYKVNYFISGLGEMSAYDPQCEFADPFVSFRGA